MNWVDIMGFVALVLTAYWVGYKDGESSRFEDRR